MIAILGIAAVLGFVVSLIFLVLSIARRRNDKKKWIINLIICLAVFLFCVSIPTPPTDDIEDREQSGNPEQSEQAIPNASEDPKAVGIDGTVDADCFDISIVDIKWTAELETSLGTITPDDPNNGLLCIIFSAKNTTDDIQNVASVGFNSYVDGTKTIPKVVVGSIDNAIVFVGAVSPSMEIIGHVVWELPNNWEEFQTSYIDSGTAIDSEQYFMIQKSDIT